MMNGVDLSALRFEFRRIHDEESTKGEREGLEDRLEILKDEAFGEMRIAQQKADVLQQTYETIVIANECINRKEDEWIANRESKATDRAVDGVRISRDEPTTEGTLDGLRIIRNDNIDTTDEEDVEIQLGQDAHQERLDGEINFGSWLNQKIARKCKKHGRTGPNGREVSVGHDCVLKKSRNLWREELKDRMITSRKHITVSGKEPKVTDPTSIYLCRSYAKMVSRFVLTPSKSNEFLCQRESVRLTRILRDGQNDHKCYSREEKAMISDNKRKSANLYTIYWQKVKENSTDDDPEPEFTPEPELLFECEQHTPSKKRRLEKSPREVMNGSDFEVSGNERLKPTRRMVCVRKPTNGFLRICELCKVTGHISFVCPDRCTNCPGAIQHLPRHCPTSSSQDDNATRL
jgi:hypothetical protein